MEIVTGVALGCAPRRIAARMPAEVTMAPTVLVVEDEVKIWELLRA